MSLFPKPAPRTNGDARKVRKLSRATAAERRRAREQPYAAEHDASRSRSAYRGAEPRDLGAYLSWMAERWMAERPSTIHAAGPYFGPPDRPGVPEAHRLAGRSLTCDLRSPHNHAEACWVPLRPAELTGGSVLGSPRLAEPFRRLMENSPYETERAEYDGHTSHDRHYVRPLHAALASMGRSYPMSASALTAVCFAGFDWQAVAIRGHWDTEMFAVFLEKACHILWTHYHEAPIGGLA